MPDFFVNSCNYNLCVSESYGQRKINCYTFSKIFRLAYKGPCLIHLMLKL